MLLHYCFGKSVGQMLTFTFIKGKVTSSSVFNICLKVLRSWADLQLYDSESQTYYYFDECCCRHSFQPGDCIIISLV